MVTGDLSQLEDLITQLNQESEIELLAASAARPVVQSLVEQGFASGQSPDGEAWAALKDGSGRIPLQGFGDSFQFVAAGNQVQAMSGKSYAVYHQTGTQNMSARKMFPEDELPNSWYSQIEPVVQAAVKQKLQGGL